MKKILINILVIVVVLVGIKMLVIPDVFTPRSLLDMSDDEYNAVLNEVRNNDNRKLIKLYTYYHMHQNEKSLCLVLCKMTTFPRVKKRLKREYETMHCDEKILCDDNALFKLEKR